MENMITQRYMEVYNRRNQAVGVFVGLVDKGLIRTAWSRVNLHKGDKFDMNKGIIEAIKNMAAGKEIPLMANIKKYTAFADEYEYFRYRCTRFFQQYKLESVSPTIDVSRIGEMFGNGVEQVMSQFLKAGLPLAEQLQRQGIMGIGIPVGMGLRMDSGLDFASMLKLIDIDGKDVNHSETHETHETPEVHKANSPVPAPDDDDVRHSVNGYPSNNEDPISACDTCNGVKGKDCPVMDGVCNK